MTTQGQFPDEQTADGHFERQDDAFRNWVSAEANTKFPLEAGRYHLYVSLACPWAHRTIIVRSLLGLEDAVSMTVVDPIRDDRGWAFREVPGASNDPINGFHYLAEAYTKMDPHYCGRVTVPVLWDKKTQQIVSNSDDDIMRMFETSFRPLATKQRDLAPQHLLSQIDQLNNDIYERLNNGVYRAGFATRQKAYEKAVNSVFAILDELEARLSAQLYLLGEHDTETDWRTFVTLIRFDAVYVGHFKCNLRRIVDYPNLWRYLRDLYHIPGISETVNFDHIKRHYYQTHDEINPTRIVPLGPQLNF